MQNNECYPSWRGRMMKNGAAFRVWGLEVGGYAGKPTASSLQPPAYSSFIITNGGA